jgi:hypothetical protein
MLADLPYIAGIAGNDIVHAGALDSIVRKAVRDRDVAGLNAMETYFRTSRSRLPGGGWELEIFHTTLQNAFEKRWPDPGSCALSGVDFAKGWAEHDPDQPGPYLAEAAYRLAYAWCIRGDGPAHSVAKEAWAPFHQNVDAAYEVLTAHADVAKRDPEFYALMERIYTAQGRDDKTFQRLLDEASHREPYYYPIYFTAAWHAMPQWGGTGAEVDRIARYAAARTRAQDGAGTYVRVYWSLVNCDCSIEEFLIDRKLLSQAMDDVFKRAPSDWNAANLARIACHFREPDLTARQFARGGRKDGADWPDHGEWERCRAFAASNSST